MKLLPRQLDGGALVFVEPFQYTVAIDAAMRHQGQLGPHHVITSERFEPNVMEAHPELKSGQPHHHAEVRCMRIHEACERQLVQGMECYNLQSLVFVFVVLSGTNTGARTTTHPVLRELQAAEFTRTCFSSDQLGRRCLELWLINAKISIT